MTTSLMIFQGVVSVLLIILVLLQFGKGAEAGLMSAADSVFTGSQKGNILTKITIVLSVLFLGNSILLAKLQSERGSKSILDTEAPIARPFTTTLPSEQTAETNAVDTPAAGAQEAGSATEATKATEEVKVPTQEKTETPAETKE